MKTQTDLHGQALALECGLSRAARFAELRAERHSPGRWLRSLLSTGEQGNAMIEFAMLLPVLLLLTTGLLVFGVAMNNYLQLTNAVSVGARKVALYGHQTGAAASTADPCATASAAVIAAAPALNPASLTFTYSFNSVPASTTSCTDAAANLISTTNATVTVTYPLNLSVFGAVFSKSNAVLTATSTELVQ